MTLETLTVPQVLDLLENAVDDYGSDWVDPYAKTDYTCKYVYEHDGATRHCIVGHVLKQLGENVTALTGLEAGVYNAAYELGYNFNLQGTDAMHLLVNVQAWQDEGDSWGEVLEQAREYAKGID